MSSPVEVRVADGVAIVRLVNGAKRNPIDLPMARALGDAFEQLGSDVGAVALLADGDHFCVGGDVRAMAASDDPAAFVKQLADEFHRTLRALPTAPPVVAGVHGWAAGAGMSLVLAVDIVIAGRSASFRPAYPGIGVTPDGGMSWTLPRVVGERQARSLLLRNVALNVDDAYRLGMVDEIVSDAEVDDRVLQLARELAAGPGLALAGAKRLVTEGVTRSLAEHLDYEAESIAHCAASPDGREGVAAFAERRSPSFGGAASGGAASGG